MFRGGRARLGGLAALLLFGVGWLAAPARADNAAAKAAVVQVRWTVPVYSRPSLEFRYLRGRVEQPTRLAVLDRHEPTRKCRPGWLRIGDGAWVCARGLIGVDSEPSGHPVPRVARGAVLPYRYVLTRDGRAFATVDDAVAGRHPVAIPGRGGFRVRDTEIRDGRRFFRTTEGWIAESEAEVARPLRFEGVRLDRTPRVELAGFVRERAAPLFSRSGKRLRGSVAPRTTLAQVGEAIAAGGRDLVAIGGDRYVLARDLARVELQPRPEAVAADARWIDVDLSEQVLVAYEGDQPVLATLVSTSRTATPVGEFHIQRKRAFSYMKSRPEAVSLRWNIDTPWVMTLEGRIAMHGVYWHDDFGRPVSHGCINLAPRDARFLYRWAAPHIPDGWRVVHAAEREGTLVRIRR